MMRVKVVTGCDEVMCVYDEVNQEESEQKNYRMRLTERRRELIPQHRCKKRFLCFL